MRGRMGVTCSHGYVARGGTMTTPEWRRSETLAWTRRDGVTPPPAGVNRWFFGAIALSMAGVWIGMLATDTLCPEHRMWVQTFGVVASVSAVCSIFGLAGQRFWAPLAALASALLGIAVGFIDAVHSPTGCAASRSCSRSCRWRFSWHRSRSSGWRCGSAGRRRSCASIRSSPPRSMWRRPGNVPPPAPAERDRMSVGVDGAFAPAPDRRRARPRG